MKNQTCFKVGDYVRIRPDLIPGRFYGRGIAVASMMEYCGRIVQIDTICGDRFTVSDACNDIGPLGWTPEMTTGEVLHPRIVVTAEKPFTTARYYLGHELISTAKAKCHPDDKFDFAAGASLAAARLVQDMKTREQFPGFFGKMVCITRDASCFTYGKFTYGKVYTVENGNITDDHGTVYDTRGRTAADVCRAMTYYSTAQFVPLVE